MGFISDLARNSKARSFYDKPGSGRAVWSEVFGHSTNKEEGLKKPVRGENRSTATSDASFKRLLQAMRSYAPGGWSDDRYEQSKHMVGIVYVAIHRQNELLTQAEFQVFEKDEKHPDEKRPVPNDHPLVRILTRPNPEEGFGDLLANWNLQMDLTGSALTWIVPNQLGQPFELYPVPTAIAIPQPAINPEYPNGYWRIQPVYPYGPFSSNPTPNSAVGAAIPAEWMMRFKYPHPLLRYEGYSPLTAMRHHIDQHESMDRSRWHAMKRGINPSAVLNFAEMEGAQPLPEPEIERIKSEFENEQQGPENSGKLFVATPGAKLEPWGTSPREMDYTTGWEQVAGFILGGGFGVTKPAAGMVEDSSYSTLFATLKQLYWLTLEPKVDRIAAKLTRQLAPHFGDNLIIEIRCKRIDDHEIRFQRIDKGTNAKCITKNEVRKELDLPPTQEEWGDEIAGTDPQAEMGMPGMPGMGMPGMNPEETPAIEMEETPAIEMEDDPETEKQRPNAGSLSEGALGPKMKRLRKIYTNGHSKRK